MALDTDQVLVANGSAVLYAPAGTAAPDVAAAPAAPWVDIGYISDDGITHTTSRDSENFGAWQTSSPIAVILTGITDTFGFAMRQWSPEGLKFVYGVGASAAGSFEPSKDGPAESALLLRWQWLEHDTQLYVPRGKITGDTETVLTRQAPADLAVELVSMPSGSEAIWSFETAHPDFVAPITLGAQQQSAKAGNAKAAA